MASVNEARNLPSGHAPQGERQKESRRRHAVSPISLHHVDEVIRRGVAAEGDVGIVDLVLGQDGLHRVAVELALRTLGEQITHTHTLYRTG